MSIGDIRTANKIFMEHRFLKDENRLLLEEIGMHNARFGAMVMADSIRLREIKPIIVRNKDYERRLRKRNSVIAILAAIDAFLALLLIK